MTPIKHVFVLMLENHSFDNMFAMSGIPGIIAATTNNSNSYKGNTYHVKGGAPSSMPTSPGHEFTDVLEQLAGPGAVYHPNGAYPAVNNSGFAANYATTTTEGPLPPASDIGDIMQCFDTPSQLPVIYQLATEFAICDQWFSSLPGPTWPNRFFVHGASSAGLDHSPTTAEMTFWETVDGFSYPNGSIYDALTKAKLGWRLYNDQEDAYSDDPQNGSIFGATAQVCSLKGIPLLDIYSLTHFASDLKNPYPYQYTFIEPNYGDVSSTYEGGSSQHPMDDVYGGEGLIKAVYEAIRNSPLWDSSLLIITYDEHGGFYDSVAPGPAPAPGDKSGSSYSQYGFNFSQYGIRVPAVIVSPLIPRGTVDHTIYDHASVLATVETLFGLKALTERDKRAQKVLHLLSLPAPRTDCPSTLNKPVKLAASGRPTLTAEQRTQIEQKPVHQSGNLAGFLSIMLKTELELSSGTPAERTAIVENFKTIQTRAQARAYIESVMRKVGVARAARKTQAAKA